MRVATFNIHHAEGLDGELDLERVADVILQTDAEVVALQELDRGVGRSGRVDQPRELERLTHMNIHFLKTADHGGGDFGIALATRTPVEARGWLVRRTPFDRRHGVIVAVYGGVSFVATHISRKPPARLLEFPDLVRAARRIAAPKVVLGDLNATGPLVPALRLAGVRRGCTSDTFPADRPRRQPDHILLSDDVAIDGCTTIDSLGSDHRALVADLRVDPRGGRKR